MRLDLKHWMELCLTMDRIPRAVVDCMWGRLTPTQEAAGIVEYKWVSIEKAVNFLDMEPLHNLGMKNGKLHKMSAPFSGPDFTSDRQFSLSRPPPGPLAQVPKAVVARTLLLSSGPS